MIDIFKNYYIRCRTVSVFLFHLYIIQIPFSFVYNTCQQQRGILKIIPQYEERHSNKFKSFFLMIVKYIL